MASPSGWYVRMFSALFAYVILLMIQASLSYWMGIPEMVRLIRHGIALPVNAMNVTGNGTVKI